MKTQFHINDKTGTQPKRAQRQIQTTMDLTGVNKMECDTERLQAERYDEMSNETKSMLIEAGWKKASSSLSAKSCAGAGKDPSKR